MNNKLKKIVTIYKKYREPINYLFVGGLTTFVNWVVYALMVNLAGFSITAGNFISWAAAVLFAFVTNKIFVFQSRSWQPRLVFREASAFLGARIVSGLIEIAGVPFLFYLGLNYPLLGIEGFAAKVTVSFVIVILNYLFSKFFIFRKNNKS